MVYFKLLIFLILQITLFAKSITIDEKLQFLNLLPNSQIYIDKTKTLTLDNIRKNNLEFRDNKKEFLSFGYSPSFNVWISFTLENKTDKPITKIIEYANPLTTNIECFDFNKNQNSIQKSGLFDSDNIYKTVHPIFKILLEPHEIKRYYIKSSSYITTLIVKLYLWDEDGFYHKEINHQIMLSLFFGAMFILGIYNLFIFFFTKDISYLYYVTYIFTLIFHQIIYVGFANTYFFNANQMRFIIEFASVIVALPVLSLGLFTKNFLNVQQYPIHNRLLNIFLFIIPIAMIFFLLTDIYDKYRNIFTMLFLIYLMYVTIYASIKKNKQAYFILFGWFIFVVSGMLMFLSSAGVINLDNSFPYIIEVSFVLEAVIFSIALANKINILQKEKNEANQNLILQKTQEASNLDIRVNEQTKDLNQALNEKNTLLRELNHRVKNNMQMIVSLIRLQLDEIEEEKLRSVLITVQNRVNAMSHLHELLYKQDNFSHINTYEYFETIIHELEDSYSIDATINLKVTTNLKMEEAIYCGLILNELITNSFKYAFVGREGTIDIKLFKDCETFILEVHDNGIGYEINNDRNSLGLTLVETLSTQQLDGSFEIYSNNGVKAIIKWEDYE